MFHVPDVTSLLGSLVGTELDLGCGILGYESHEKHDSMKELKDERSENKLKRYACNCVCTSHSLLFIPSGRFRCSADGTLF